MKRYYMDITPASIVIYVVENSERHRIWVDHPEAKEITKQQYENIKELTDYFVSPPIQ